MDDDRLTIPWRCDSPMCGNKRAGWWISIFGVVQCLGCKPPDFPETVAASGPIEEAPLVLADRTTTLATAVHGDTGPRAAKRPATAKGVKPAKAGKSLWD